LKQRTGWTTLLLLALASPSAWCQLLPVGVPRGVLRIELGGEFRNADSRFDDGKTEDIARGFTSDALGGSFLPTLAASELTIGKLIGDPTYRLNAGRTTANGLLNIGTASIGASYGLSRRLTLFASLPIVRTRMQIRLDLDSTSANAGFNPNDPVFGSAGGQSQTGTFFAEFGNALVTLGTKIANGDYDANPAQKALAQQALTDGTALRDGLIGVLADPDAPFVPLATSSAGVAISNTVSTLQTTLAGLNVSGFSTLPALASQRISDSDLDNLISNPGGPIRAFPLRDANRSRIGDVEAGFAYTLIDRWNRKGRAGGVRLALEARGRFPTGLLDRPDDLLDVGTGTGHFAARLTGTLDMGIGRIGSRFSAGYEHRFPAILSRRIGTPFQPFAFASRLSNVRSLPGGLLDVSATPFFRLAPSLAILGGIRLRRNAQDQVSFASVKDSIPGVNPGDLALGTRWTLTSFQAGLTYVSPAASDDTRSGLPVEASWIIEGPLSGSGGIVAKERIMRMQLRLYGRLFK
jgi:hypothetical protein